MNKTEIYGIVISLIKSEITESFLDLDVKQKITSEILPYVYSASKAHDMAHIVGYALQHNNIEVPPEIKAKFVKQQSIAVFRYERIKYELDDLCAYFDEKGIPYMPLKGSVIRKYYPCPEMRTSCDIDILVKKKDLAEVEKLLVKEKGYKREGKAVHDVSLFSPSGVHVELHFQLMDKDKFSFAEKILEQSWTEKVPYGNSKTGVEMGVEYLIAYLTLHNAKHFYNGGCGIRAAVDAFFLNKNADYDSEVLCNLLEKCKIKQFYDKFNELVTFWFDNGESNDLILKMQDYILNGGVYGTFENKVELDVVRKKSKFAFITGRLFLPFSLMAYTYPVLEKVPILYPFCIVARWFKLLSPKQRKRAKAEMSALNADKTLKEKNANFLREIGL